MVALAADRDTAEKASPFAFRHTRPVAAGVLIYQGALVALDAAGFLAPVTAAAGLTPVGRAEEQVDNTLGAPGAVDCDVRSGIFPWVNDGVNPVALADTGSVVYGEDDQTVSTNAAVSVVGVLYEFDAVHNIAWVATQFPASN